MLCDYCKNIKVDLTHAFPGNFRWQPYHASLAALIDSKAQGCELCLMIYNGMNKSPEDIQQMVDAEMRYCTIAHDMTSGRYSIRDCQPISLRFTAVDGRLICNLDVYAESGKN
jgi:hypothetical protein